MSSQWRAMVEVRFRDLVIISFILGVMALTMSTMLAYFSTGMQDNPMDSVRVGIFCGCVVTGLTLMYGGWRLIEINRGDNKTEKVNVLDELKSFLSPVEAHASSLFWADERPWRTSTHVKVDRGTLTLDLHDLDVIGAKRALDVVIENRPIIQTYEHLLFQPHGQGTWWNTSPSCGWTEKWTYEGEFKNWAPSGQGKLILHTSGTVIEGKIDSYNAHGFLSKGTVTFLDGKTTEESNLKLFSYVKDGFTEFLDELELNDILLFPLKVAAGTVIVAGEVAYSPAGQAAIAIQEAKNQKKREEAIYKKGKEDGRKGKR